MKLRKKMDIINGKHLCDHKRKRKQKMDIINGKHLCDQKRKGKRKMDIINRKHLCDQKRKGKIKMDIINSLHDDILCHIVSFLSAKEAAIASLLSKRWRHLCTIIQYLEFDDMSVDQNQGSLMNFVDGVLALPLGSRIRRFTITCEKGVDPAQHAQVNRCICNVLKNRGVLKVKLDINGYSLPFFEVFTCKTVVKLELGIDFKRNLLPKNAFLPALTTLVLDSLETDYAFRKHLFVACPMLRKIELGSWWDLVAPLKGP